MAAKRKPIIVRHRMWELLKDGEAHGWDEVFQCLTDSLANRKVIRGHLSDLRKELPAGQFLTTEYRNNKIYYRLVCHISYHPENS